MTEPDAVLVCTLGEIDDGEAFVVTRDETGWSDNIALFFCDGTYRALDDTCPHDRASLSEGWVEGGVVECLNHSTEFSLNSGAALCGPASACVRTHQVEVRGVEVWVLVGTPAELPTHATGPAPGARRRPGPELNRSRLVSPRGGTGDLCCGHNSCTTSAGKG